MANYERRNNDITGLTDDKVLEQIQRAIRSAGYNQIHVIAEKSEDRMGFTARLEKYIESLRKLVDGAKKSESPTGTGLKRRSLVVSRVGTPTEEFGDSDTEVPSLVTELGDTDADDLTTTMEFGDTDADGLTPNLEFGDADADDLTTTMEFGDADADGLTPGLEFGDYDVDAEGGSYEMGDADDEYTTSVFKREIRDIPGGCNKPEDVLVTLLQLLLMQGPSRLPRSQELPGNSPWLFVP